MKYRIRLSPLLLLIALCLTAVRLPAEEATVDSPPALSGLTGLIRVPTAEVLSNGELRLGYNHIDDESPGMAGTVAYDIGLGFLPKVEGVLGIGNDTIGRDLTAHGKWQVREESDDAPAVAIGLTDIKRRDIKSSGSLDPTPFVVATKQFDNERLALTLGAAFGPAHSGVLVGASYRIQSRVELQAEYDTDRVNAGVAWRAANGLWLRVADTDIGGIISASYQFLITRPRQ